jgi:polysaccharide biosynthesis/export protein
MVNIKVVFIGFIFSLAFVSCVNTKNFRYFQDLSDTTKVHTLSVHPYVPVKIQVNDQVQVIISSLSPDASQFFNLMTSVRVSGAEGTSTQTSFQNVYAVAANGTVTLPVLGDLQAEGLTLDELKEKLLLLLQDYLKDVIVSVRIVNFKVTLIGQVGKPQVLLVDGDRINVLQALGMAGDMSGYGNRINVKVMRTVKDSLKVGFLDFTKSKIVESQFFHLQQNDIVYVEPIKSASLKSESFAFWIPIVLSIVSTIFLITWRLSR